MINSVEQIQKRFFKPEDHPYRIYEREIVFFLKPEFTVLDAGCGHSAPVLRSLRGKAKRLIGIDVVQFDHGAGCEGMELIESDLARMDLDSGTVDLAISRSVLEHIAEIESVYREIYRVLKPGGRFLFLVPSLGHYVSIFSSLMPNRLHPFIVSRLEGRDPRDVFPTYYRSNTERAVRRLSRATGFECLSVRFLGQYPSMLKFNPLLFLLGILYVKITTRIEALGFLREWMLVELRKPSQG